MSGTHSRRKVIVSGMLGNGLEWYDYAIYGHMTVVFSQLFFSFGGDAGAKPLILTYLTFAAGFVARPVGAILFGRIGDRLGRKRALTLSMIMMAIPTAGIGLLPTYAQVGMLAPIALLALRVIQGLSLGGAFSGSMSYVVEHAEPSKRASTGSLTMLSLVIGFLLGSLVSTVVSSSLSESAFLSWGWRLPFLFGILIGVVGYWIRNHGDESPVYKEAKESGALSDSPVKEVCLKFPLKMLEGFSFYAFVTLPFYLIAIYMIGYSNKHLALPEADALQINSIAMIAMLLPIWPAAKVADRIGRKPVMLGAILAMAIALYPAFKIMQSGQYLDVLIGQATLAFINGWYLAAIPAVLVEIFPTRVRYTGMAMSYNLCAILGGFTPSFAEALIDRTGSNLSIMHIITATGIMSLIALLLYKDRYKEKLI